MGVGEALAARAMTAAESRRHGPVRPGAGDPVQVVIKGISRIKSKQSVSRALRYIGRLREEDRENGIFGTVPLYDGAGRNAGRDVPDLVRAWRLLEDAENISALAKAAGEHATVLEENEVLRENQAIHFTWSGGADASPEHLRVVTLAFIDAHFTSKGHASYFGIHTEHVASDDEPAETKPHVHILVAARAEDGKRLVLGRNELTALRHSLAEEGRSVGLNITAEAREDREEVRDRVLDGKERLRTGGSTRRGGRVEVRTPGFWSRHGRDFLERAELLDRLRAAAKAEVAKEEDAEAGARTETARAAEIRKRVADGLEVPPNEGLFRKIVPGARLPKDAAYLAEVIKESFHDADAAARRFREMALEGASQDPLNDKVWHFPNLQLAKWYMRRRPMMFGRIRRKSFGHKSNARLLRALEEFRPETSRNEVSRLNRIDRKEHEEATDLRREMGVRRDKARIIESHENLSRDVRSLMRADSLADQVNDVVAETRRRPVKVPPAAPPHKDIERNTGTPMPGPEGRRPGRSRGTDRGQER